MTTPWRAPNPTPEPGTADAHPTTAAPPTVTTGPTAPPTVAALDARLREWSCGGGPFDPGLLAAHDEKEAFPAEACAALDAWGLPEFYVPARYGGRQERLDEFVAVLRRIAARDLTVAVAHGKTFLGGVCVWAAGDDGPAHLLARHVLAGEPVAWGLTEPGGGSDLLAGSLTATRHGSGWRLSGRKWPVNNATRGNLMCVLARTEPSGGARGFSLFVIDRRATPAGTVRPLPKMPTHGIRGADISGLEFDEARVPAHALVGTVGGGLELVLKSLQLTRIVCVSLSLGAGDHALALLRRFLGERRLYGRYLADLPHARDVAGRAVARQFLAETVAHTAARAAHQIPEQLSVVSAVAKAFVPGLIQGQLRLVGDLLGARGFLTEVEGYGAFAKLERDHQVVPLFDGSTWVNRAGLAAVLPVLRPGRRPDPAGAGSPARWLRADHPLDPLDADRLRLMTPRDALLGALPGLVAELAAEEEAEEPAVTAMARALLAAREQLGRDTAALRPTGGAPSTAAMRLAERYEWCFAGAAALALHRARPELRDGPWGRDALWLRGCLAVVLEGLGAEPADAPRVYGELGALLTAAPDVPVTLLDATGTDAPVVLPDEPSAGGPGSARDVEAA
ncbi:MULTISPECIES: acyl-CoA dehydrogenase family protein [Streptomyces]|uniref:Acyl-CoA dehydrogenase n=2 Tax=Streptomyces TaxID=1883 RepID=A0A2U9P6U0_STRAS|nr:acyl-CoA dehydrogenase [Streptomyces actuosus]AWT45257.1 acyl-CoA dehydrogenase [Streptomyces actuosus]MBM4821852.1 acyl-CoA dehydrogenase [Streptomyces actuosus]